jgi:hypothetical protein
MDSASRSIDELVADLKAAQTTADKARIAREIGAVRAADDARAEKELADERDVEEQLLLAELPQGTLVTALSDLRTYRLCGVGVVIVQALSREDRPTAVRALHRVAGTKMAAQELFETGEHAVLEALLRCVAYPRRDDPERAAKLQRLVTDGFGLAHAAYRAACSLAGVLATATAGKSDS